jgi:hypothetical protein
MLAKDVVEAVRNRLGDINKERWSDPQLLLYVSLCQIDICIFTNYYKAKTELLLDESRTLYQLPSDLLKVDRLEYRGEFFPIHSRNEIDKGQATFPCALKDNMPQQVIELMLSAPGTTLRADLENTFGRLQDLGVLTVFYSAVPSTIANLNDKLILSDMWMSAFIHYVSGMALQDDNDANNIQRGELEMKKYSRILDKLYRISSKDFTNSSNSKMDVAYRKV